LNEHHGAKFTKRPYPSIGDETIVLLKTVLAYFGEVIFPSVLLVLLSAKAETSSIERTKRVDIFKELILRILIIIINSSN
jgi:hypothetical protein